MRPSRRWRELPAIIPRRGGRGKAVPGCRLSAPTGTSILSLAVIPKNNGDALVAVSGPGVAVAEIHAADEGQDV
jgi:hypothetical protein